VDGMKETRLVFHRKGFYLLQTRPPNPRHLRIFHEGVGDIAKGGSSGILGRDLRDPGASVNLNAEAENGKNHRDRTNALRDGIDRFPVHQKKPRSTGLTLLPA